MFALIGERMKIYVAGTTGEGKSTMSVIIARALREKGFEVSVTDLDGPEEVTGQNLEAKQAHMVARGTTIEIEARQMMAHVRPLSSVIIPQGE